METLDTIVKNYLMEAGLGLAEYTRAYHLAVRGLKDISFDTDLGDVYTAPLYIQADGTAELPEDCLKVVRIARMIDGNLVSLTRNSDLSNLARSGTGQPTLKGSCHCKKSGCRVCRENVVTRGDYYNTSPYWKGGSYGIGSYQNYGEYKIQGNLVLLSPDLCNNGHDVVIEYKALPSAEKGELLVHPYVSEALIAFVRWKMSINRKNQDKWDKQYFEKEWHRLKANARYRMKSPTKQELNQHARKHTKAGLKS